MTLHHAALSILLASCALAATPPASAADAACSQWDVSGTWAAVQSNGTATQMTVQQTGTLFQGSAHYSYMHKGDGFSGDDVYFVDGPVVGSVKGNAFEATVYWNNNTVGSYTGQIGSQGLIVGNTFEKANPGNAATWNSNRVVACQPSVIIPPPAGIGAVEKPAVKLGRVQLSGASLPAMSLCETARSAKARNSPAAPDLERRCLEGGGSLTPPPPPPPPPPVIVPVIDPANLEALAALGAVIAEKDPAMAEARASRRGIFYQRSFDIATALFGDPALGAAGKTQMDPDAQKIRDLLGGTGQRGFDDSVALHLSRVYKH